MVNDYVDDVVGTIMADYKTADWLSGMYRPDDDNVLMGRSIVTVHLVRGSFGPIMIWMTMVRFICEFYRLVYMLSEWVSAWVSDILINYITE